jgi:hypothetical protein
MDHTAGVLIGAACLVIAVLAAFAAYRWRQQEHARRVKEWVRRYLVTRYGELPDDLKINCTDDRLWPVLVAFDRPHGGTLHVLRFACHGPPSSVSLLAEREETRP